MSNVLKSDASAADAYVEFDPGSPPGEVWAQFQVRFDSAALAFWVANAGPDVVILGGGPTVQLDIVAGDWDSSAVAATANEWHTVIVHYTDGVAYSAKVDGVTVLSGSDTGTVAAFLFGQISAQNDAAAILYIANVKIGTTQGASDIFADDFSSGNLSAWSTTSGDVSVVSSPFPPPPSGDATIVRRRLTLARANQGLTVRVQQDGPSAATEIYALETIVRSLDPGGGP